MPTIINGVKIPRAVAAEGPAAVRKYAREHGAFAKREQDPEQRDAVLAERAAAAKAAEEQAAKAQAAEPAEEAESTPAPGTRRAASKRGE